MALVSLVFMAVHATFAAPLGAFHETGYVVPPVAMKCHSSSVVQTKDGHLLACWFYGVGERKDDTLVIQGAWKPKGATEWGEPFVLADSQDLPDCNPSLFIDPRGTLWLFWAAIQNNEWGGALLKYRKTGNYAPGRPVEWEWQQVIHCRPRDLEVHWQAYVESRSSGRNYDRTTAAAASKLDRRIGWMTRTHPIMLDDNKMIVGLYSDVFNGSLMAMTEDEGRSWQFSEPVFGGGNIQPSLSLRKNGELVALMRDNGRPQRIRQAVSRDDGVTWSAVDSVDIPNPGSSVECIVLESGHWLLVCNDSVEKSRSQLTAYLSDDEGLTWGWKRHLETDAVQASYPSVIQLDDGGIFVTYTYYLPRDAEGRKIRSIKWAQFSEDWVRGGETLR